MWPFPKRRQLLDEAHLELVAQIHGLVQEVKALRDDLASLEDKHERLRGKFYASRSNSEAPAGKSKAEILREFLASQHK